MYLSPTLYKLVVVAQGRTHERTTHSRQRTTSHDDSTPYSTLFLSHSLLHATANFILLHLVYTRLTFYPCIFILIIVLL